jgi:hypothetical protein
MIEMIHAEDIVIEVCETYTKQTCRNHCLIYGPNGKQTLSIPVIRVHGNRTLMKDIRISYHQSWQRTHWRSIETAYNNSPFFLYYQDDLAPFFQRRFDYLIDFNMELLFLLLKLLKAKCRIALSDGFIRDVSTERGKILVSKKSIFNNPPYPQPFASKLRFIPNLSIIDCLFNLGPETSDYLRNSIN